MELKNTITELNNSLEVQQKTRSSRRKKQWTPKTGPQKGWAVKSILCYFKGTDWLHTYALSQVYIYMIYIYFCKSVLLKDYINL